MAQGWDKQRLLLWLRQSLDFFTLYLKRCQRNQINVIGGYLAYISFTLFGAFYCCDVFCDGRFSQCSANGVSS